MAQLSFPKLRLTLVCMALNFVKFGRRLQPKRFISYPTVLMQRPRANWIGGILMAEEHEHAKGFIGYRRIDAQYAADA
jgi:hypothetical protein